MEGGFLGSFIDFSSTSALIEDTTTRFVAPFPCAFDLPGEQSSAVMKSVYWLGLVSCWVCDVDEMAFIHPSVTRTKESNIYASIWVLNPDAQ